VDLAHVEDQVLMAPEALLAASLSLGAVSAPLLLVAWLAIVAAIYLAIVYGRRAQVIRTRLSEERATQVETLAPVPTLEMSWLRRWLFVAGFRRRYALPLFLAAALGCLALGLGLALLARSSSPVLQARVWLYELPGGLGAMMDPVLTATPWLLFLILASLPWLYVRAARRKRVNEIEEDLPISLQLLATLSRAGLGLDAALLRVVDSSDARRTLPQEFSTFRRENLSGIPRVNCWRRLARRVEVGSVSIFVAAMVHAEQVGGGISGVLDHQAEDVQSRRREHALIKAHALPVKLVFPLVICFLPGIFIWTLGPAFYRFIEMINGMMRGGS
jgi:tight adherence protein C